MNINVVPIIISIAGLFYIQRFELALMLFAIFGNEIMIFLNNTLSSHSTRSGNSHGGSHANSHANSQVSAQVNSHVSSEAGTGSSLSSYSDDHSNFMNSIVPTH